MFLSQFRNKVRYLGSYELQEDAARAFDQVARILGRSGLNFPNSDALEIHGWRSEGADKAVAAAVEAARSFVAANGKESQTSMYTGVSKVKSCKTCPWMSYIRVSCKKRLSKIWGAFYQHALMRALMHAH